MLNWLKSLIRQTGNDQPVTVRPSDLLDGYKALETGNSYFLSNRFSYALPHYDKAIELGVPEAYVKRAICLQNLQYHFDALIDFDYAISISPEDCNYYFMRAWSRIALRMNEEAIADIKRAITLSRVGNERNRVYDEASIQSTGRSITETYEQGLSGIEAIADLNVTLTQMNRPLEVNRRPTS